MFKIQDIIDNYIARCKKIELEEFILKIKEKVYCRRFQFYG